MFNYTAVKTFNKITKFLMLQVYQYIYFFIIHFGHHKHHKSKLPLENLKNKKVLFFLYKTFISYHYNDQTI